MSKSFFAGFVVTLVIEIAMVVFMGQGLLAVLPEDWILFLANFQAFTATVLTIASLFFAFVVGCTVAIFHAIKTNYL